MSDKALTWFTSLKPGAINSLSALEKLFLDKFNIAGSIPKTRRDLANIKQRDEESPLSYLDRLKKTYDEIEGISQDTVIMCFEGGFKSRMLYIEFQLRKPETIGEMFNVARKVALAEGSAQDGQPKRKERLGESTLPTYDKRGKKRTRKTETFTPLNVPKESLVAVIKDKFGVWDLPRYEQTRFPHGISQNTEVSITITDTPSRITFNLNEPLRG